MATELIGQRGYRLMVCRTLPAARPSPAIGSGRWWLALAAVGYLIVGGAARRPRGSSPPPGCTRRAPGGAAIPLDSEQAGIAATIAGVADQQRMPPAAVTIAYAAALQESKLHNLDYGDRDSVGVFQQRPSQGWGTTAELEDPVYATTKFFAALARVPGYPSCRSTRRPRPCSTARTAPPTSSGSRWPRCWPATSPAPRRAACPAGTHRAGSADLAGALKQLTETFGPQGTDGVLVGITTDRSAKKTKVAVVHVQRDGAWTVAGWLVTHAQQYGISQFRYGGFVWDAGEWQHGLAAGPGVQPDREPRAARQYCRGLG